MYGALARSRITINQHIDLADGFSNNMRLYEATGCGALMIVDRGRNLQSIFEPEKEVISYRSAEECGAVCAVRARRGGRGCGGRPAAHAVGT